MTRHKKNNIRGFILLIVFSLNTVAGFACSIGVDMGYNKAHHNHDDSHSAQKNSEHSEGHQHEHTPTPLHNEKGTNHSSGSEDDCCTTGVADFIKLDKSVNSPTLLNPPVFLVAFISRFLVPEQEPSLLDISYYGSVHRSWHFTDDTDLRIVIQSFQI